MHVCVFALFHCLCCSACVVTVALRTESSPGRAVLGCSQGVYSSCLYSVVCPPPRKRQTVISSPPNRWKHAWKTPAPWSSLMLSWICVYMQTNNPQNNLTDSPTGWKSLKYRKNLFLLDLNKLRYWDPASVFPFNVIKKLFLGLIMLDVLLEQKR